MSLIDKVSEKGVEYLSDRELVECLVGPSKEEIVLELWGKADNSFKKFFSLNYHELLKIKGIGQTTALKIIASNEISKRKSLEEAKMMKKISSSRSAFELMQPLIGELEHEEFWILYLNNSNKVLHTWKASKGGMTGTLVDIRLILKKALELNAICMVIAHNHPSGTLNPSQADIGLTKKIKKAGETMDIKLLDHIIVTDKAYYSFADENLL